MYTVERLRKDAPLPIVEWGPFLTIEEARSAARQALTKPLIVGMESIRICLDGDEVESIKAGRQSAPGT